MQNCQEMLLFRNPQGSCRNKTNPGQENKWKSPPELTAGGWLTSWLTDWLESSPPGQSYPELKLKVICLAVRHPPFARVAKFIWQPNANYYNLLSFLYIFSGSEGWVWKLFTRMEAEIPAARQKFRCRPKGCSQVAGPTFHVQGESCGKGLNNFDFRM